VKNRLYITRKWTRVSIPERTTDMERGKITGDGEDIGGGYPAVTH
jgi:hypothetical protein